MSLAWPRMELEPPECVPGVFKSPGLEVACTHLNDQRRFTILDLGAASARNVAFYSRFPCRVFIEDLYRSWSELPEPDPEHDVGFSARDLRRLITHDLDVRFDLILGWDLFDYLPQQVGAVLVAHLAARAHRDTLLYALTSTRAEMPERPSRYMINENNQIAFEPSAPASCPSPRHTPLAFEKMMKGFRLLHSFMLRNGIQEYVFSTAPAR